MKHRDETFIDGSMWEKSIGRGDAYLKRLIQDGLTQTSVTVVLIGSDTVNRRWVNYEMVKSFERGNGLLGLFINRIKGRDGKICSRGPNPLSNLAFEISGDGRKLLFFELIKGQWYEFNDLPRISNKKSNTLYFENGFFSNEFGKFFRFSDKFETYCWNQDDGNNNFTEWIEDAAEQAGR